MTTIKVDSVVRDRLAGIARARGQTMGALLSTIADRLEAEQEWAEIEEAYARLRRGDPAAWQEYLRELAEWEVGGEPDTTAAEEWPEYNR
jgi:predicted transcriptional regulator